MKSNIKIIFTLFMGILMFFGCEDNEKSPLPAPRDGSFVTIVFDNLILDVSDLENSAIIGTLDTALPNVASYDLEVRRTSEGASSDYVPIFSTTTFPTEMVLTPSTIATALGITQADLLAGDRFDFQATSTSTDGAITSWSTINLDLQGEAGQLQSYQYTSYISCPFNRDDATGTWEIVDDGFLTSEGNQFEIIAGDDPELPGELILINPFNSSQPADDETDPNDRFRPSIIVDEFGIATMPSDASVEPADPLGYEYFDSAMGCCGNRFAPSRFRGEGFLFACTGFLTFTNNNVRFVEINPPTGSIFGWTNAPNLVAQKVND
jgi:hypothetical protein